MMAFALNTPLLRSLADIDVSSSILFVCAVAHLHQRIQGYSLRHEHHQDIRRGGGHHAPQRRHGDAFYEAQ